MKKEKIPSIILPEHGYAEAMENMVLPYLAKRKTEKYCERESGKPIFYVRCLADEPRGIAILSHGYTETAEKHLENIYYFLRGGYHVFMPEHCGHGRSYRLVSDPGDLSLVHVDDYQRYVDDLLFVTRLAAKEFPELPICLYGHSMGGGIAAAAAAREPKLFSRLILSSPMIRPNSAPVPWHLACLIAGVFCLSGRKERYIAGHHPYEDTERFEDSASVSQSRFDYYQKKRNAEPLFQMSAASYGWLLQTARLNHYLMQKAWRRIACPVLLFQAEDEKFVSLKEQKRFIRKLSRKNPGNVKLFRVKGSRHEIFNSGSRILKRYWQRIL